MNLVSATNANKQTKYYIKEKIILGIEESIKNGKFSFIYHDIVDENICDEFKELGYAVSCFPYLKETNFFWRE